MMTRRQALKHTAAGAAVCAAALSDLSLFTAAAQTKAPFTLAPLPYPADALEPHIDARTMEIHHGRHHAAYVANLNNALDAHPSLKSQSLESLLADLSKVPADIRAAVQNHGGGHYNHVLFWETMSPKGGGQPKGKLAQAIETTFHSFDGFKSQLTASAMGRFGSGWAWLTVDGGHLRIESTPNQDTTLGAGLTPLLGVDVWEHAYYLKYQYRRADYVAAWFNLIHWDLVSERYEALTA
jgi:superoxide dismutase, Fe-Mn family